MKTISYKNKEGNWENISVLNPVGTLPVDGEPGQVLTKTETGVEFKTLVPEIKMWVGTLEQYAALASYEPNTLYFIEESYDSN